MLPPFTSPFYLFILRPCWVNHGNCSSSPTAGDYTLPTHSAFAAPPQFRPSASLFYRVSVMLNGPLLFILYFLFSPSSIPFSVLPEWFSKKCKSSHAKSLFLKSFSDFWVKSKTLCIKYKTVGNLAPASFHPHLTNLQDRSCAPEYTWDSL